MGIYFGENLISGSGGGHTSYGVEVVSETLVLTASTDAIEVNDETLCLREEG